MEAAEAAEMAWPSHVTGLKPGANEIKTVQTILKTQPENFAEIKSALDRILRPEYHFSHEPDRPQIPSTNLADLNVKLTRRGGARNAWPESAFRDKLGSPVTGAGTMGIGAGPSYRTTS